ncbi:MAG: outer membrane beta-barrel protein [Methylobacter sp.]|uniref:XrtB/PEP-CTERM-associated polysaccharide biosynthesis outer membrane protein EpsL n=1 Tax=Methylicorpusculum sp. TaxID=2713644 RepID=UPI002725C030|nr:XrtB/PEP-CTERM-associated polysaccharide biosynthesis outer membrane protein EpsL [Methylicorpusculum sp.]MDO9139928.1 outer membrane beta-barrel protein [Methylobacter sp.]MDP2178426.1 outer membrane beta-barrel protein [Methylicorpusculum sp.]MDP2429638.1 outer membrane beta-barrel protein [Methylobacter sp.]MDP3053916.1 outer membrane beta-barrel protein [Methylobacter sp.]MDP3360641.1 outer membrane beta-barrel protein [Methylobacter sp.]
MTKNTAIRLNRPLSATVQIRAAHCGKPKSKYLLPCFMLLLGGGMPGKSIALPGDTVKPYAAFNMLYDSNFLRLSDDMDSAQLTGKNSKDDFVKQLSAGFDMDWNISRQHFIINANVNQNWFQNFTNLDYTGWDTQAQWNWQLGNNFNGEIGYANTQMLGSFAQLGGLFDNLQNNQRYFANGGYLFHPNGKITLGVFRTKNKFDGDSRQVSNNTEDNAELNLQYLSPTESTLGLRVIATDGSYPQRPLSTDGSRDTGYTRMNYAVTWDWRASSKTRIDGLVGYTQQNFDNFSALDFSDIVARLNLHWQTSDKLLLELSGRREITLADNLFASFLLTQGVWFNLRWQTSPKITLELPVSYQEQNYLGGSNNSQGFEQQKDKVGMVGLNVLYRPIDSISIGLVLNYEKRDSNYPIASYETQSAGLNLQMVF